MPFYPSPASFRIPKGKTIEIHLSGQVPAGLIGIPIILDEDVTLTLNSNFEPVLGNQSVQKIISVLGALSAEFFGFHFSTAFKEAGFQVWTGTDPLSVSLNVSFRMGSTNKNDGRTEVWLPTIALASLTLPQEDPENKSGIGLYAPGPSMASLFGRNEDTEAVGGTDTQYRVKVISIDIGSVIRFDNIIIKRAEPTFSSNIDEKGYPIWSKVNLTIDTITTATVELLTKMPNKSVEEDGSAGIDNSDNYKGVIM